MAAALCDVAASLTVLVPWRLCLCFSILPLPLYPTLTFPRLLPLPVRSPFASASLPPLRSAVSLRSGWWLAMTNVILSAAMLAAQSALYGPEECCYCAC